MLRGRRNLALLALIVLHGVALLHEPLTPYGSTTQHRDAPYAPPTRVRFIDADGRFHWRPFVYRTIPPAGGGGYTEDRTTRHPIRFLVRGDSYRLLGAVEWDRHLFGVGEPALIFLLGSDGMGRDLFTRLLAGGRISLFAGLLATALALGLGTLLGSLSGFYGGRIDAVVMRLGELFMALPWLYLLLGVRAFLPLRFSAWAAFFMLVTLIGIVGWAAPARLTRGVVLSAKEREYVLAARGFGASSPHLLRRHLLPQVAGLALTQGAILVPRYILAEVALSYLGLGISPPLASWGNLLAELERFHVLSSYWWMATPAVMLAATFLVYQMLARSLQADAGSPF